MREEKGGWRIDTFPDKIKVSAITQVGMLGLTEFMGHNRSGDQLRAKLNISRIEYPHVTYEQLSDGKIFRVIFSNSL